MSSSTRSSRPAAAAVAAVLLAAPAAAEFHQMYIVEVFGGDATAPDAQYVMLQMWSSGQRFVDGHAVEFFGADGASLGEVEFLDDVDNGADQARILIATSTAEAYFGIEADLLMPARLATNGGKVCFAETIDCVAWGSYAPDDSAVGDPYQPVAGLEDGEAMVRRLDICQSGGCSDSLLDGGDDTNDSASDFVSDDTDPGNNSNDFGNPNPDAIFLHGFENGSSVWSPL